MRLFFIFQLLFLIGCREAPIDDSGPQPDSSRNRVTATTIGQLQDPLNHPTISHVHIVDLNEDGLKDVLVCDVLNKQVSVIEQTEHGEFAERSILDLVNGPVHAEAVDIDLDGDLDVMVAAMGVILPSTAYSGQIFILENDGTGHFVPHLIADKTDRVTDVRAGDLDGDGDIDLSVAQFGYTQGKVRWYENQGQWNFVPHQLIDRSGAIHAPIADIDNDGDLDIIALLSQEWETVVAFVNDGKGSFMPVVLHDVADADFSSSGISIADLDSDGDQDVVWTNGDAFVAVDYRPLKTHGLQWLENKGSLEFQFHRIGQMDGAYSPATVDFDGDGDLDIVTVSEFAFWDQPDVVSLRWWSQEDDQSFTPHNLASEPTHLVTCDVGDLDGNGEVDIVAGGMALYPPFDKIKRVITWMNPNRFVAVDANDLQQKGVQILRDKSTNVGTQGMILHANGFDPSALYRNAILAEPSNPKWPYMLGLIRLSEGNSEQALELFLSAEVLDPTYPPLLTRIGELYEGNNELELAERYLNKSQSDYARVILSQLHIRDKEWVKAESALNGVQLPVANQLLKLIQAKQRNEVIQIETALDMGFQMEDAWKAEMESYCESAPLLVTLAQTALINNKLEDAERLLRKAIALDDSDKDARLAIATLLLNNNRLSAESLRESIIHLEHGMRIDPSYVMTRAKYAWALYLNNQPNEARAVWKSILKEEPFHGPSLTNLAQLELQLNNNQLAYDYYARSFQIPEDSPFELSNSKQLRGAVMYRFGLAANRLMKQAEAEGAFKSAIALDQTNYSYYFELGNLYLKQKSFAQAEELLLLATALEPNHARLLTALGYTKFNLGQVEDSLAILKKAVNVDATIALAWFHLAAVQKAMGNKDHAIESLTIAVQLQPRFQAAKTMLDQLKN